MCIRDRHGWLRNEHLQFKHGNALEYPLPESDVFILNDMLHYMSYEHQQTLLLKCAGRLPVSYTHLDVYKRQDCSRCARIRSET